MLSHRSDSIEATTTMSGERWISVELIHSWIWRCVDEHVLVDDSDLRVTNLVSGHLIRLPENRFATVLQDNLRHMCGSNVLAIKPRSDC
jgi:hypothetical protein